MARKGRKTTTIDLGKKGKIKMKKGTFTSKAKKRGMTPAEFQAKVLSSPGQYSKETVRQARLRKTLVGFN